MNDKSETRNSGPPRRNAPRGCAGGDAKSRILLVDDHLVVIDGIRSALENERGFEVVGYALNGRQAVKLVTSLGPDIVILDVSMPGLDGVATTMEIKGAAPETRIVIFTMHSEREYVVQLFKLGISAYVLKEDPTSDLILALKSVRNGGCYFSSKAPTILMRHVRNLEQFAQRKDPYLDLSKREREVFLLLAEGKSVKAIAQALYRSPKTVESHKYRIMEKLGAETGADLTRLAIRKSLIKP